MKKNVSGQKIGCQMVSASDGSAFTGSVTVYVTGDAGTQAAGSVGSGACTHEGNGYHTYAPAQAETNYDLLAFTFIGTGAVPATVQVFTSFPQTGDAYATATNIETDTQDIQSRLPAALVSGRIDASVGAMASGVLTATAIAGDAITAAKIADGAIDAATFAAGAINASAIAADAITAAKVAADVTTELQSGLATAAALTTVEGKIDTMDGIVDAILVDTGTDIPATLATVAGYLDTEIAAIKAKTDSLTFTVAGQVDANVQYVNDTQVNGTGALGDEWGP